MVILTSATCWIWSYFGWPACLAFRLMFKSSFIVVAINPQYSTTIPSRKQPQGIGLGCYTLEAAYLATNDDEWIQYIKSRLLLENKGGGGWVRWVSILPLSSNNNKVSLTARGRRTSHASYEISLTSKKSHKTMYSEMYLCSRIKKGNSAMGIGAILYALVELRCTFIREWLVQGDVPKSKTQIWNSLGKKQRTCVSILLLITVSVHIVEPVLSDAKTHI